MNTRYPIARTGLEGRTSPSYIRVRNWLLEYIAREKLEAGDRIPSERILAKALGLSRPTVARAVAELVSEGILMREQRSGTFVGDKAAARRKSGARTVGVLMPWLTQDSSTGEVTAHVENDRIRLPYWRESMDLEVLHGAVSVLNERGCRFLVLPNNTVKEEAEVLSRLPDEEVDGALVMPADSQANEVMFAKIVDDGLPIVFIDRYCPSVNADRVTTDNLGGAKRAVQYLVGRGHRRIAFFTDFSTLTSAQDRLAGYKAGLEEAGIPYDDNIVCGPQIARYGWWRLDFALEHCLGLPDPITAVVCMNDTSVLATLEAAERLRVSIPGDLDVIGFFDDRFAHDVRTPFARMKQSTLQMGQLAAQLLMDRIDGKAPAGPQHILLPAELVTEDS